MGVVRSFTLRAPESLPDKVPLQPGQKEPGLQVLFRPYLGWKNIVILTSIATTPHCEFLHTSYCHIMIICHARLTARSFYVYPVLPATVALVNKNLGMAFKVSWIFDELHILVDVDLWCVLLVSILSTRSTHLPCSGWSYTYNEKYIILLLSRSPQIIWSSRQPRWIARKECPLDGRSTPVLALRLALGDPTFLWAMDQFVVIKGCKPPFRDNRDEVYA